jgi:hypothetical protein
MDDLHMPRISSRIPLVVVELQQAQARAFVDEALETF